jgi:hypothetical protein
MDKGAKDQRSVRHGLGFFLVAAACIIIGICVDRPVRNMEQTFRVSGFDSTNFVSLAVPVSYRGLR